MHCSCTAAARQLQSTQRAGLTFNRSACPRGAKRGRGGNASQAGAQQTLPCVFPLLGGLPRGAGTARHCLPTLDEKRTGSSSGSTPPTPSARRRRSRRCAGFTADLAALARAFCESNAKVDDQAQGIKTLMDMLESTATHRQLSELEERLTARFDKQISVVKAEHQAQVHAVVASAKQDSVELDVWREWVAGQFGRLSERSWLGGGTSSSRCSRAR